MAASWAVIWDRVCDFLHGKSQALSEGSAVKPAIRGSPTYSQSFTARLKSCPDTKLKPVPFKTGDIFRGSIEDSERPGIKAGKCHSHGKNALRRGPRCRNLQK